MSEPWLTTTLDAVVGISTVALLAVTYWYARTTRAMAATAKDAADESRRATAAAERSALAAQQAAQVAQSQIRPEFSGRTVSAHVGDNEWARCILFESSGDAVVVQKVRVRRAFRESQQNEISPKAELTGVGLNAVPGDPGLPRRLHLGERVLMTHPALQTEGMDPFHRFIIDVEYTFVEGGSSGGIRELIVDAQG